MAGPESFHAQQSATDAKKESDAEPDWAASDQTWVYDPVTRTVADGPQMTVARKGARAALLPDGKVLVAGDGSTAELYDPVQNSFTATGSTTVRRKRKPI